MRQDVQVPALQELRQLAVKLRPDLLALRRDILRAQAELKLQQAGARQDLTVGTEYRRQQGINGKSNSLGFFVEVPIPLFDRNEGEIERARQERSQTELRLQAQEQAVIAEIDTAYQQYAAARDLLQIMDQTMLGQAREVREITDYSYRRGDATLLELLDSQRAYNETMQGYNEARAEYARALYLLDSVSGKEAIR
jgi:cobalt-zinc-cadmium efflux system outer membrane protein